MGGCLGSETAASLSCHRVVSAVIAQEDAKRDKRREGIGKKGRREEERRRWREVWWGGGAGGLISGKFKWSDEKKLEGRAGGDKTGFRVGEREREGGGEKCYFKRERERERDGNIIQTLILIYI